MRALQIASSLYIIQAGIGLAVGFTIPWLKLLQDAPVQLCSVSEIRVAACGEQDAERERQREEGAFQDGQNSPLSDF